MVALAPGRALWMFNFGGSVEEFGLFLLSLVGLVDGAVKERSSGEKGVDGGV